MSIKQREKTDWIFKQLFKTAGIKTILLLTGIFPILLINSIAFFLKTSPVDFFTGYQWKLYQRALWIEKK